MVGKIDFRKFASLLKRGAKNADDIVPPKGPINPAAMNISPDDLVPGSPSSMMPSGISAKVADDMAGFTPGIMSQAPEVVEAAVKNNNARNLTLAGLTGAGIVGTNMSGNQEAPAQEQQIPFAPGMGPEAPIEAPVQQQAVPKAPEVPPELPTEAPVEQAEPDYLSQLKEAQDRQNQLDFVDNMLRAGTTIGAGLAYQKPDYTAVDALQKQNAIPVQNLKDKMKTEADQNALGDAAQLRDPNSEVSKSMRKLMKEAGFPVDEKMSAKNLKDTNANAYNILMNKLGMDSRERIASMNAGQRGEAEKRQRNNEIRNLRKDLTSGEIGKEYKAYKTAGKVTNMIQDFAKDPTGYSDYGTLMNSLKVLQGDDSVVREAEMRLGMQSGGGINNLINEASKLKDGKSLRPSQRQDIIKATTIMAEIAKRKYNDAAAPILETARRIGIPESELLDASLVGDKKNEPAIQKAGSSPSGMVKVTRKSDGASKMMTAEQAAKADKSKYTIGN